MQALISSITWDVSPYIFDLKIKDIPLPITWYGLLFTSGFVLGYLLSRYIFRVEGRALPEVDTLALHVVVATVVGARLGHYLFYEWPLLVSHPVQWLVAMITPPFRGLASHGGTFAILVALYLYKIRSGLPFFWITDRVILPACVGATFIRLGNLMNSEIYGTPTDLPWGFLFVHETDPVLLPVVPRHPTQLYEAVFYLLLFIVFFGIWRYKRHRLPEGFTTGLFLVLLFSFRFGIEFLKNNQVAFENSWQLNMGQLLSLPVITIGVIILLISRKKSNLSFIELSDSQL
jgi:prolipoprotein diacylglyceryl transferase